jgi:hypothetical protein
MARSDSQHAACSSAIVGVRSAARLRARSSTAALPAARALAGKRAPRFASELHTPSLGSRKSRLRMSRDHPGFQLGNGRHLLKQEFADGAPSASSPLLCRGEERHGGTSVRVSPSL